MKLLLRGWKPEDPIKEFTLSGEVPRVGDILHVMMVQTVEVVAIHRFYSKKATKNIEHWWEYDVHIIGKRVND